jgi:1-acyl-sn-glycerol-3-phosphate acyltransferase
LTASHLTCLIGFVRFLGACMKVIFQILKLSLVWIVIQLLYLFAWLLHVLLYPYLRWVKKHKFPFTYLGLIFIQAVLNVRIRYLNVTNQKKIQSLKRCVILSNHRSWADFLICNLVVSPGSSGFVSRAAVSFLLPVAFFWQVMIEKNAVVFNRGKKIEKTKQRLYKKMADFLQRGGFLLVFPEGHRYLGKGTLPLKRGIIRWAFKEGYPCAIVLCKGSENVIHERTMSIRRGVSVVCEHKAIYNPADFGNEREFFSRISEDFRLGYEELEGRVFLDKQEENDEKND